MAAYPFLDWSTKSYTPPQVENTAYMICSPLSSLNQGILMVVCDGAASMTCRAQAARLTAYRVMQSYFENSAFLHPQQALAKAVREAWQAIREQIYGECVNMKADICAAVIVHDLVFVAQIGDIGTYTLRADKFSTFSQRNETDSSDIGSLIMVRFVLDAGDRILLCNKGIYKALNEAQILGIVRQRRQSEQLLTELIEAAGIQNQPYSMSAALLSFNPRPTINGFLAPTKQSKPILVFVISLVGVIGLLLFGFRRFQAQVGYPAKPASVTSRTSPSPKPTSQVTGRPAAAAPTTGLGPKHIGTATTFPVQLPSPKSTNTLKPDSIATVVPTTKVALQVATTPSPTALTLPSAFTETSTPTPEVAQQVFVRVPLGTSVNIRRGANIRTRTIGVLRSGQIAELVGRSSNHQWWQIQAGARLGWVFAGSVSIYGDLSTIPIKQ